MKVTFENVLIKSIACSVPSKVIDLRELYKGANALEIEKIIKTTGISKIREADVRETSSDLCQFAAETILTDEEIGSIDGLLFVSQTRDHVLPQTSIILQHKLALSTDIICIDMPLGCSGYIYGLFMASALIESRACSNVLVLAGDTTSRLINPRDRAVKMVFGDAGSATLMKRGRSQCSFVIKSDGSGAKDLIVPAGGYRFPRTDQTCIVGEREPGNFRSDEDLYMDGMGIMNFAIKEVPLIIDDLLEMRSWRKDEIGAYVFHQANEFMVKYLAKKMKLNLSQVPICVEGFGNTGPASIPLTLCETMYPEKGVLSKTIMCGFGVGLSWGAASFDLSQTKFYKTAITK